MQEQYSEICLNLSNLYFSAIEGWEAEIPTSTKVTIIKGSQGVRLSKFKSWLYDGVSKPITPIEKKLKNQKKISNEIILKGYKIEHSQNKIISQIQDILTTNNLEVAKNIKDWYAKIGDYKIAPKWLVSKLTGLPVSKFDSTDARRVLLALGIEIEKRNKGV